MTEAEEKIDRKLYFLRVKLPRGNESKERLNAHHHFYERHRCFLDQILARLLANHGRYFSP